MTDFSLNDAAPQRVETPCLVAAARPDLRERVRAVLAFGAAALVSLPGIRYLKPRLAQRTVYRRSFSEGLAVFEQEPRGKGAAEWNALAAVLYADLLS